MIQHLHDTENKIQKLQLMNTFIGQQYLYCLNISIAILQMLTYKTLDAQPRSKPQKQESHRTPLGGHVKQLNLMFLAGSNTADT